MRIRSLTALFALVMPLAIIGVPAPASAVPKFTECATPNPAWVDAGVKLMQTLGPASSPGAIGPEFFSLEVAPEITTPVTLNGRGYQRIWDMGVSWKDINPAPGVFKFDVLDERVRQVEASGAKPLYVLGLTPQWAAADPSKGDPRWGAGTASMPSQMGFWDSYVRAVANRYNGTNGVGKIAAFEVWNEANISTFWDNGDENSADPFGMGALADMTKQAMLSIKEVNPDATVITATTTTRVRGKDDVFGGPQKRYWYYVEALKARGFPFDAWGIHSYPAGNAGPTQRIEDVTCWQEILVRQFGQEETTKQVEAAGKRFPTILGRPIFDTEVNFGLAGPGSTPSATYDENQSQTLIWRTYLDSARLGIDSTTWYLFSADTYKINGVPMGVQMFSGQPAVAAYTNVLDTMLTSMNPFQGCTNLGENLSGAVKACSSKLLNGFTKPSNSRINVGYIVFAEDAFAGPTPTEPFNATLTMNLVPWNLTTVQWETRVTSVTGSPVFVYGVQGLNSGEITTVPDAPTITDVKVTYGAGDEVQVSFSWTPAATGPQGGISGYTYRINEECADGKCPQVKLGSVSGGKRNTTVTFSAAKAQKYVLRLDAKNKFGASENAEVEFVTLPSNLVPPTNLKAVVVDGGVRLLWEPPKTRRSKDIVLQFEGKNFATVEGKQGKWLKVDTKDRKGNSVFVSSKELFAGEGEQLVFRVRSTRTGVNESAWSKEASVTYTQKLPAPSKGVIGVFGVGTTSEQVAVADLYAQNYGANNIAGYEIQYQAPDGAWVSLENGTLDAGGPEVLTTAFIGPKLPAVPTKFRARTVFFPGDRFSDWTEVSGVGGGESFYYTFS